MHSVHMEEKTDTRARKESPAGKFVTLDGERYYCIDHVDRMPPFFISVVSDSDHWLFAASNGALTAGRTSPETALFPYITVDKIYDSTPHTGGKTIVRTTADGETKIWEPLDPVRDGTWRITRRIYKNVLGNKLVFEEINHDLNLAYRCRWHTSDDYGFVRVSELENVGRRRRRVEVVDGMQNILPAGAPRYAQTNTSYLLDAYKWNELDEASGLAMYSLFSKLSDRAAPAESLRTTTVFCLGLRDRKILLSSEQLDDFREGRALRQESLKRGVRGAYFIATEMELAPAGHGSWRFVADLEQSQGEAVGLVRQLDDAGTLSNAVTASVAAGSDALARIMGSADGFQTTDEEVVSAHHYTNVLFNVLRGGIVDDQYRIARRSFAAHLRRFNREVYARHEALIAALPDHVDHGELMKAVRETGDPQLDRLAREYLPITFGRRHGDPSRPWNQYSIRLRDENGERLLAYEGNWRDIFQNWEALLYSYPEFTEQVIAKFVNASTADGYNPYRITSDGIDWEVEEPDDPWSYIGYWGDHQIIYLQKLLELSHHCHPDRLARMLSEPLYAYANVPYRIRPFEDIVRDAKNTVAYDTELAARIDARVEEIGADGKLLADAAGNVVQVALLEKLLVPLLAKLGNLVVDGGIWLNTQRPEWNDANNAIVGNGLSMVTLCYMRRYVRFLRNLLDAVPDKVPLSTEVATWLSDTATTMHSIRDGLANGRVSAADRFAWLEALGKASCRYRCAYYESGSLGAVAPQDVGQTTRLLDDALAVIDHCIDTNRREDGLYHAYNLLDLNDRSAEVDFLYPMLEGQVAALSSGAIPPQQAVEVLDALFNSSLFREDQKTFLLYPDRDLPRFLQKNRVPEDSASAIAFVATMLADSETRILARDPAGTLRFNADISNADDLGEQLDELVARYGDAVDQARPALLELYEDVFNHRAFTGRSGGMFGFEGLGSVYWHMVGKLLLAVQENFFASLSADAGDESTRRLGELYYRVRDGLGFNKSPLEYGAFPVDPYSHTPGHMGAQQPGMTGQVKEEMLARFGELGIDISDGAVRFETRLLRSREFLSHADTLRYLDVRDEWQELELDARCLAFTWCQVPIVYHLDSSSQTSLCIALADGTKHEMAGNALPPDLTRSIFQRDGGVQRIDVTLGTSSLFS